MKKIFITIFLSFFALPVYGIELDINSKNAILYNLDEGTILYEKAKDEKIAIASMTKIVTAIVSIENIENLDEQVTLTYADFAGLVEANASVAGFRVNQKLTYRDLLYGLLLPSGADAAQALTRLVGGSHDNFIVLMNDFVRKLGLENTHFENETGLDEENHYSTVYDVAQIFKYALQNPEFKKIISSSYYKTTDNLTSMQSSVSGFIKRYNLEMSYVLGGKTGTTKNAGRCLASFASENGTNYLLVTARAGTSGIPENVMDAKTIYEYFIENYENKTIIKENDIVLSLDTKYATEEKIDFLADETIIKYLEKDFDQENLIFLYDGIEILTPKIEKNTRLGQLDIIYDNKKLATLDIILESDINFSIISFMKIHYFEIIGIITFSLILIIVFSIMRKKKKI